MIVKEKNGEGFLDLRICDNLELMAEIQDNTIDLIYCDILYGTGRKFKDYQDLKPIRSEIEKHYIPRIKEMHRILKNTGCIYLQMDTRINHWIRCIMDDVFGYDNFVNEIIWKYKTGGASKKYFPRKHDNIFLYSKSKTYTFNKLLDKNYTKHKYGFTNLQTQEDENGFYYLTTMSDVWEIAIIRTVKDKIDVESVDYSTQKPKALIERLVKASSNEGDLVADFYSGSFTTAEVCKDLKRNFIGCDINPNCFEKAKERGLFSFTDLTTNVD
jgi:site-specific DNA-methyltransferase (adenine-specific)